MSGYISSNDNRFYVAAEAGYGSVAAATAAARFPAVKINVKQKIESPNRKDKTGSRTFTGMPTGQRRNTTYDLTTYLCGWSDSSREPSYGPLFQAALGSPVQLFHGATVQSLTGGTTLRFAAAHGLSAGQAVVVGSEIRFAASIPDPQTIQVNAPFSLQPAGGFSAGPTANYGPGEQLSSVSLFDYWSPASAVQRIVSGAGVDQLRILANGDYHEFQVSGPACDVIDSASFEASQGGLSQFPAEPGIADFEYAIVPGNLGQAWIGTGPSQFFTITKAEFTLSNGLATRSREFGSIYPRALSPSARNVSLNFSLYGEDDSSTSAIYQAARQRSPVSVFFQLGQQAGQLCGVYLPSLVPEVPAFDDSESRLQWSFSSCRAQGSVDDEFFVAFG